MLTARQPGRQASEARQVGKARYADREINGQLLYVSKRTSFCLKVAARCAFLRDLKCSFASSNALLKENEISDYE
jgi:hypothetical protein